MTSRLENILIESKIKGNTGKNAKKLTVKLWGKGVFPSAKRKSGSQATQYYIRMPNQLIWSKLDFLNGAIGVVPHQLSNYESTLDLPAFDVSKDFIPQYVSAFLSRESFYKSLEGKARGGRKAKRVSLKNIGSTEIPRISIEKQTSHVKKLSDIERDYNSLNLLKLKIENLIGVLRENLFRGVSYFSPLSSLVTEAQSPVTPQNQNRYQELGIRSHGKGAFIKPQVLGKDLGKKRVFQVHPNALMLNVVFAWEGALVVTEARHSKFIVSHRFPQFILNAESEIPLPFILQYFLSSEGLKKLSEVSPGGAGRNKTLNKRKFLNIEVPTQYSEHEKSVIEKIDYLSQASSTISMLEEKLRHYKNSINESFFLEIESGGEK